MTETTLKCEQAIFTSIRTPMGEGYRIVAASRGLGADQKQVITRNSPSHDGLCAAEAAGDETTGVIRGAAFYPLPRDLACVAVSGLAGAEHTGRGGQRIYTHCVAFDREALSQCGYNPFNMMRAMVEAGLHEPQLKPPATLPELELKVTGTPPPGRMGMPSACRCRLLQGLLDHRAFVVNCDGDWLKDAEWLLMGIPGPARVDISFDVGLRFSVGRTHRLHLLQDATGMTKSRVAGQAVEYLQPEDAESMTPRTGTWLSFVERMWSAADVDAAVRRTSVAFADTSPATRDRIARLFTLTDEVDRTAAAELIAAIDLHMYEQSDGAERDFVAELTTKASRTLLSRMRIASAGDVHACWKPLLKAWRRSPESCRFAEPLLSQGMRNLLQHDPLGAARSALDMDLKPSSHANTAAHESLMHEVLNHLAAWITQASEKEQEALQKLVVSWRTHRPSEPLLEHLASICVTSEGKG